MTLDDCTALCANAGLHVLSAAVVGKQVCVTVAPFTVTPETVVKRLGVAVTVSFGDGRGQVQLWFWADSSQARNGYF